MISELCPEPPPAALPTLGARYRLSRPSRNTNTHNLWLWWTAVSCSMSAGNPMLKRAELSPHRSEQHVRYMRSK